MQQVIERVYDNQATILSEAVPKSVLCSDWPCSDGM
jgi:hypothetical protein